MKHFRTRNSIILFFGIALLIIVAIASTSCVKNDAQPAVDNLYPHTAVVVEVDDVGDCVYAKEYRRSANTEVEEYPNFRPYVCGCKIV